MDEASSVEALPVAPLGAVLQIREISPARRRRCHRRRSPCVAGGDEEQRRDGDYGEDDGDGVAGGGGRTELGRHGDLRLRMVFICVPMVSQLAPCRPGTYIYIINKV